ncbi:MAG: caspase family protein [Pyrinomonadaceae bacterium]
MLGKTPPSRPFARVFTFALLATLLAAPSHVSARRQTQDPGSKSLTQPKNDEGVIELPDRTKRYAVVIGIDKYTSDPNITALRGAANDAKAIADALVTYAGFKRDHVRLLTSDSPDDESKPIRNNILTTLKLMKRLMEKDAMLVVAFSGHGVERQGDRQAFLLPADASSNPEDYDDTAISVDRVKELIRQTGASQVMLLLDSCRNDPTAGKGSQDNKLTKSYADAFDMRNSGVKAFVTLYAASEGQRAWEYQEKKQGYFSWAFVEGLKGGAKDPTTGEVTLGRLIEHMQTEVPRLAKLAGREQKPQVDMVGYGGNLLLAKTAPIKPPPAPVVAPAAPTTGTLSVVSEPGARIVIEPLSGGTQSRVEGDADDKGVYKSGQLQFGEYRVIAAREGSETREDKAEVAANKPPPVVPLNLKKATYTLTIIANTMTGSVAVGAQGGPTQVYQLKDGRAVAADLSRGDYTVAITPDDVSLQPEKAPVTVTGDREHTFTLKSLLRKQPLDAEFALPSQWRLPSGWRATPALEVNGEGRAMLSEEVGRFADFELSANVELVGGTSVSFVVRAADEQNYYLVRLSGPRADVPNMLSLYLVKNGQKPRSLYDISLRGNKLDDQFIFGMKATGDRFDFFIDDNSFESNGKPIGLAPIGKHSDSTFAVGGVGVAAGPGDKAKIFQYMVCPGICAKN